MHPFHSLKHLTKPTPTKSFESSPPSFLKMLPLAATIVAVGLFGYVYKSLNPPSPKICGSPGGPPVTSPRIKLRDGRHLAYRERGVDRRKAKYKVVLVHGFDSSKDIYLPLPQEFMEELDVCIITYDRAGYGESDPNPNRDRKSEVFDIQELADQLQLGQKFHLMGVSIGTYSVWACMKYIPHRLAGVSLIVPVINFWWPSFPPKLVNEVFKKQPKRDRCKLWIAHHMPGLFYWWMSKKFLPRCAILDGHPILLNRRDGETFMKMMKVPNPNVHKIRQQGENDSLYQDVRVHFASWEFDPMELKNPFPNNEGSVYLWHGHVDKLVPFELQRYLVKKLPWINYREIADGGHLLVHEDRLCQAMFKELLLGEEPPFLHSECSKI